MKEVYKQQWISTLHIYDLSNGRQLPKRRHIPLPGFMYLRSLNDNIAMAENRPQSFVAHVPKIFSRNSENVTVPMFRPQIRIATIRTKMARHNELLPVIIRNFVGCILGHGGVDFIKQTILPWSLEPELVSLTTPSTGKEQTYTLWVSPEFVLKRRHRPFIHNTQVPRRTIYLVEVRVFAIRSLWVNEQVLFI